MGSPASWRGAAAWHMLEGPAGAAVVAAGALGRRVELVGWRSEAARRVRERETTTARQTDVKGAAPLFRAEKGGGR